MIKGALEAASDFFNLPTEEKEEFESNDPRKPVRYFAGYKSENTEARELLKHYASPLSEWIQGWPVSPPDYR